MHRDSDLMSLCGGGGFNRKCRKMTEGRGEAYVIANRTRKHESRRAHGQHLRIVNSSDSFGSYDFLLASTNRYLLTKFYIYTEQQSGRGYTNSHRKARDHAFTPE